MKGFISVLKWWLVRICNGGTWWELGVAVVGEHGNVMGTRCGGGRNWERDGNPESRLVGAAMGTRWEHWISGVGELRELVGNLESKVFESIGNHESQEFESIGNFMGTRNLRCWRALGTWRNLYGNALGYVILLAGLPLPIRLCVPACLLRVSSCEAEETIDRASHGPKKEEFPNLGDRNSGGLHFPRSEFRLPRALRS
jgi:hypothetical protein